VSAVHVLVHRGVAFCCADRLQRLTFRGECRPVDHNPDRTNATHGMCRSIRATWGPIRCRVLLTRRSRHGSNQWSMPLPPLVASRHCSSYPRVRQSRASQNHNSPKATLGPASPRFAAIRFAVSITRSMSDSLRNKANLSSPPTTQMLPTTSLLPGCRIGAAMPVSPPVNSLLVRQ